MKNIFRPQSPAEPTVAQRAEWIADLDAEERRNEEILNKAAQDVGDLVVKQEAPAGSKDSSVEG